jgi:sulfoxide reductase catalytic subunit YedY
VQKSSLSTDEPLTPYDDITNYNNFYEFDTNKYAPAKVAKDFRTKPWSVAVEGEVDKPAVYQLEDLIKPHTLEERIYRLRCVEGWSMVIPWVGFPLGDVIKRFEPTSKAKYVEFTTLLDPVQMPGQRRAVLKWPYGRGAAPG